MRRHYLPEPRRRWPWWLESLLLWLALLATAVRW